MTDTTNIWGRERRDLSEERARLERAREFYYGPISLAANAYLPSAVMGFKDEAFPGGPYKLSMRLREPVPMEIREDLLLLVGRLRALLDNLMSKLWKETGRSGRAKNYPIFASPSDLDRKLNSSGFPDWYRPLTEPFQDFDTRRTSPHTGEAAPWSWLHVLSRLRNETGHDHIDIACMAVIHASGFAGLPVYPGQTQVIQNSTGNDGRGWVQTVGAGPYRFTMAPSRLARGYMIETPGREVPIVASASPGVEFRFDLGLAFTAPDDIFGHDVDMFARGICDQIGSIIDRAAVLELS